MLAEMLKIPESSTFYPYTSAEAQVSPGRVNGKAHRTLLGRLKKESTVLCNVGGAIEPGPHLAEVLWKLYRGSSRLVDASNFALAIYDDRTDTLVFPLAFDQGKKVELGSVKLSNNQGLMRSVFTSRTPLLIQDLLEAGILVETDPICPARPVRSWLSVPIYGSISTNGRVQGVIVVWSYRPNAFTNRQLRLLSALGAQAAETIRDAWPFLTENAPLHKGVLAEREWAVEVEEHIRQGLARDLHDGPTQLVSAIMMQLNLCQKLWEKNPALLPEQIGYMQDLAERAIYQMRTMLFELRPIALETQGLGTALQVLLDRRQKVVKTTTLTLELETCQPSSEISRQEAKVEAVIFAIVQEAVNNALKHAQADHIKVHLKETSTAIHVTIVDDGQGFDVNKLGHGYEQQGNLGIVSIRERAELIGGELEIKSASGQGTRITFKVPKSAPRC